MKKVSIIVPIYNVEKYLLNCIESLINQTYKNIEVVVMNDGSVDKSEEIVNELANMDSRMTSMLLQAPWANCLT